MEWASSPTSKGLGSTAPLPTGPSPSTQTSTVPIYAHVVLLATFKGNNPDLQSQAAFNAFITALEHDEQRFNDAFLLKNLLLLDLIVEERIFLGKIADYYNNQIVYMNRSGGNQAKEFIIAYYAYIKEKAKNYEEQPQELAEKQERLEFMKNAGMKNILMEVNRCFKVQNGILIISNKYQKGNKSSPLVEFIYSCLLKTFLFCYSIVSLGIKELLGNVYLTQKKCPC